MSLIERLEGQRYAREMLEGVPPRERAAVILNIAGSMTPDRPADYRAGVLDVIQRMQFEAAYLDWSGVVIPESARLGDSYRLPKLAQAWHWFKVGAGHV